MATKKFIKQETYVHPVDNSVYAKLNRGEYKNTLPYPNFSEIIKELKNERCNISGDLTATEISELLQKHNASIDERAKLKQCEFRDAYYVEERRLNELFKQDLLVELGLLTLGAHRCELVKHPKADLLFDKAWELGRSSGLPLEVVNYAYDLVDLVK